VSRKLIAASLSVAVQVSAVYAPLVHAHFDDHETDHHSGRQALHAHFAGHAAPASSGDQPGVHENEGGHAVFVQVFVAVACASLHVPFTIADSFELTVPDEAPARRSLLIVHGHDPPDIRSLPSRAPPAFLS
jgi:hypothetical protein